MPPRGKGGRRGGDNGGKPKMKLPHEETLKEVATFLNVLAKVIKDVEAAEVVAAYTKWVKEN